MARAPLKPASMDRRRFIELAAMAAGGFLLTGAAGRKDFDLIIRRGRVFDGGGGPGRIADLGISGDRIHAVGKIPAAKASRVIDAEGLAVCPGFIDLHNHTAEELLIRPTADSMIQQGVTTLLSGNCGYTPFPIPDIRLEEARAHERERYGIELTWRDMAGFLDRLEKGGCALNYATLVGHGAIRGQVVGLDDRAPTPEELARMQAMVAGHMKAGAFGLSSGLFYAPGNYADKKELIALCEPVATAGGLYATHMRSEGDHLLEAIDEALAVARGSGAGLQISHLKAANRANWDKIDAALKRIDAARAAGVDVHADRYPYTAASTGLAAYFPLWSRQGTDADFLARLKEPGLQAKFRAHLARREQKLGSWDKVLISYVQSGKNKPFEGQTIAACAAAQGKDAYSFMRDLLIEEDKKVAMVTFVMSDPNLAKVLGHRLVGVGSDGAALAPDGPLGKGKPHPRSYGTFPRALGPLVRERKIASLPEMIRKLTAMPAAKLGLVDRGRLRPGACADIVIFDPARIRDRATYADPHRFPAGIDRVLVNGQEVVRQGSPTGRLPGRVLRKGTTKTGP